MKAAVLYEVNKPLVIEDISVPNPGPREVLIRTAVAGLCHSDLHFMEGLYPHPLPAVLGHESAGVVEKVGSDVTYVKPGDHVVTCLSVFCGTCEYCSTGRPVLCTDTTVKLPPGTPLAGPQEGKADSGAIRSGAAQTVVEGHWEVPDDGPVADRVRDAGRAGFGSLIGYVRATFVVALVDAVGIGTGLAIMGIPLALPLASLVFLGAFVPLVGAVITGFVAVVVALIAKGWIYALIALGLIIAVQQLEAHVLQPIVMGRAVSVHPLAVVLAIAGGSVTAGVIGALIAVPIVAFLNSAIRVLIADDPAAVEADLLAKAGAVAAAAVTPDAPATAGPPGAADPEH